MFFIVRGDSYFGTQSWGGPSDFPDGFTFRRFMAEGFRGEAATMRDWETHLSTLFPEVRLKRNIELRGADAGPMPMAAALGALWRGLLDDTDARAAAWDAGREPFVRGPRGAAARGAAGGAARPLRRPAPAGSGAGADPDLRRGAGAPSRWRGRSPAARAAVGVRRAGRTPADDMLDDYEAVGGDPAKLVAKWELKA